MDLEPFTTIADLFLSFLRRDEIELRWKEEKVIDRLGELQYFVTRDFLSRIIKCK